MAVVEINIIEGHRVDTVRRPGSLIVLEQGNGSYRAALISDSDTVYYIQAGRFSLAVPVAGPHIDGHRAFGGRLRWRGNRSDEPYERSPIDPTQLAFRPRAKPL